MLSSQSAHFSLGPATVATAAPRRSRLATRCIPADRSPRLPGRPSLASIPVSRASPRGLGSGDRFPTVRLSGRGGAGGAHVGAPRGGRLPLDTRRLHGETCRALFTRFRLPRELSVNTYVFVYSSLRLRGTHTHTHCLLVPAFITPCHTQSIRPFVARSDPTQGSPDQHPSWDCRIPPG